MKTVQGAGLLCLLTRGALLMDLMARRNCLRVSVCVCVQLCACVLEGEGTAVEIADEL